MKFRKNLYQVLSVSDPEWAPFWLNYKDLKRKIARINKEVKKRKRTTAEELVKSDNEIDFFRELQSEVKKINEFFDSEEELYRIRKERTLQTFTMLKDHRHHFDGKMWTTLLVSCLQFYKDMLFFENYAIMNYCGISKILKKHDKHTGFITRDAFMMNVVNRQKFSKHATIDDMLRATEQIFNEVSSEHFSQSTLREEERLFISAMHHLNYQASRLKAEEVSSLFTDLPTEQHPNHILPTRTPSPSPSTQSSRSSHRDHSSSHPDHSSHSSSSKCALCPKDALDIATDELISAAKSSFHSPNLRNAVKWIQKLNKATVCPHVSDHEEDDEEPTNL